MDIKNVKRLVELMNENDLSEFELEEEGFRISLKRPSAQGGSVVLSSAPQSVMMPAPAAGMVPSQAAAPAASGGNTADEDDGLEAIKSPIVGTFYRAPAPDAEPFVTIGQHVDKDSVVCIIEAMKVMNEIKAEVSGVVRKILVDNATPVQFDQPLIMIEPA